VEDFAVIHGNNHVTFQEFGDKVGIGIRGISIAWEVALIDWLID
jgi:hypothetical protein